MDYTLTVSNIGNADATGVKITDPVPANTTFVSADNGGTNNSGVVTWTGLTVPAAGSATVHVSGEEVTHYKFQLNDGPLSGEIPVTTPIELRNLANGSYTLRVLARNAARARSSGCCARAAVSVASVNKHRACDGGHSRPRR